MGDCIEIGAAAKEQQQSFITRQVDSAEATSTRFVVPKSYTISSFHSGNG